MYPGRWRSEQVGVNAPVLHSELPSARNTTARRKRERGRRMGRAIPGTAKKTTFLSIHSLDALRVTGLPHVLMSSPEYGM